jgi:hypothetical protein
MTVEAVISCANPDPVTPVQDVAKKATQKILEGQLKVAPRGLLAGLFRVLF